MCGRNRGGVTTEADLWYLVGMSYRLRRSSTLPITLLLASLTGCPDDPMGDGTTGDDSTGSSTGAMTMTTAPTTMTTAMTSDGTGTGTESSSGPGPDSTATEGESSSSGGPVGPEIEVSIDMTAVATGDLFDVAETVDVGMVGTPVVVTIDNVGTADLAVNGVSITAGDDAHFTLDTAMLDAVVPAAGSTSFTVTFAPTNGGLKELTLSIDNDDADEAPFEVTVGAHTTPNTYRVLAPAASPSARYNAAMVDLGDGRLLMFGGRNQGGARLNATWVYDVEAGTWSALSPMTPPPIREAHAMAFDGVDTVILFGGNTANGGAGLQDTWAFDVVTEEWTMMAPPLLPSPRFAVSMVTVADGTMVLYGGRTSFGIHLGDTWAYDVAADTWTDLAPAGAPTPRSAYTMGFDGLGTITLFGGYDDDDIDPGIPIDQTWRYDVAGNSWSQAAPTTTPGPWFVQTGSHYADGSYIVHSGKLDTCCNDPDPGTWAYDPSLDDWADITPASEPTPRFNAALAYVQGHNKSIIFGGNLINIGSGGADDATIEYVGPRP